MDLNILQGESLTTAEAKYIGYATLNSRLNFSLLNNTYVVVSPKKITW